MKTILAFLCLAVGSCATIGVQSETRYGKFGVTYELAEGFAK